MFRCPGQDQRFWKPGDIFEVECPECKATVEFWKDDPRVKCRKCGEVVTNPHLDMGCAKWCKYAKECLGISSASESLALRDKLISEIRTATSNDEESLERVSRALEFAEKIQLAEGGDPLVVKAATVLCYLNEAGCRDAGKPQESGANEPVMREILVRHGVDEELIEQICRIVVDIGGGGDNDTMESKVVGDAVSLAGLGNQSAESKDTEHIDGLIRTETGRRLVADLL